MSRPGILHIALALALISVPVFLLRDEMDNHSIRKDRYWFIKTSNTRTYEVVFGGDSRIYRGVSPAHFLESAPGRTAYNYGYIANGFGAAYMDGLEARLDSTSDFRMLVLGITPRSITRKAAAGYFYHKELGRTSQSALESVIKPSVEAYFMPYRLEDLWKEVRGKKRDQNSRVIFHPDGWVESWWIRPDTMNAARSYKTIFVDDEVDDQVTANFLDRVGQWQREGIHVVGFRPPASHTVRGYEEQVGLFDQAEFVRRFRQAGGIWLDVDPDAYDTFDGSHLEHQSAIRLSEDLVDLIREQVPDL